VQSALTHFTETRRPVIEDYQAAAFESMKWFENAAQYMHLTPMELAFSVMTRSGRVTYEDLKNAIQRLFDSTRKHGFDFKHGSNAWLNLVLIRV
jgi:anthraniloyl-CoA monooxygenase